jgi:hypothetical protein|tara:strand:+ start:40452 stop:40748 length:297 start_codon:yes stop_codon:yes gene_type:complete
MTEFKFDEDKILDEVYHYLSSTYSQHYTSNKSNIQAVDIWNSLGTLESTARDNALKYLLRYGKKDGKNRKDLLKAIHYIVLMIYTLNEEEQDVTTPQI